MYIPLFFLIIACFFFACRPSVPSSNKNCCKCCHDESAKRYYFGSSHVNNQSGKTFSGSGTATLQNVKYEEVRLSGSGTIADSTIDKIVSSGKLEAQNIKSKEIITSGNASLSDAVCEKLTASGYVDLKNVSLNEAEVSGCIHSKSSSLNLLTLTAEQSTFIDSAIKTIFVKKDYSGFFFKEPKPTVLILDGTTKVDSITFETDVKGNKVIIKGDDTFVGVVKNGILER